MSALVAIVGRPNVGKSTLFNRLTKSRQALVDDMPGVTRDRLYGRARVEDREVMLVDTGGFDPPADQAFAGPVHQQIEVALAEADLTLFLLDAKAGLNPQDFAVADRLRRSHKPVLVAVNKVDNPAAEAAAAEFYQLGFERLWFISAAHGHGLAGLSEALAAALPPGGETLDLETESEVAVALLGRPNVGKSSLLNALLGQERAVVSETPGTTRDATDTPLLWRQKPYRLVDTAGIRRQGRVAPGLERATVLRSLRALDRCAVAVVLLDAAEGVTDQDLRLAGLAVENHRGLVLALNKWDLVKDPERQKSLRADARHGLRFAPWAPQVTISAKYGQGLDRLMKEVAAVWRDYGRRLTTSQLNQALSQITQRHQPPMVKGRRPRIFYATQARVRPPTVVLFVSDPKAIHFSYRRYLQNELRTALGLAKSPLKLLLRPRAGAKRRRRST